MSDNQKSDKGRWIKVHSGLLELKHIENMGVRIWLFLHILNRVDWETGILEGYTDGYAAEALGKSISAIRGWRRALGEHGYISWEQGWQSLTVTVHNWRNPHESNPDVINPTPTYGVSESCHHTDSGEQEVDTMTAPHHRQEVDTPTLESHYTTTHSKAGADLLAQDMLHMAHVEAIAKGVYDYQRMTDKAAEKGQAVLDELYALVDKLPAVEAWADFADKYRVACPGATLPSAPDKVAKWAKELLCSNGNSTALPHSPDPVVMVGGRMMRMSEVEELANA